MNEETLRDLLEVLKKEFINTLKIEVSSEEENIILDVYFDSNVIDKIRTEINSFRGNI